MPIQSLPASSRKTPADRRLRRSPSGYRPSRTASLAFLLAVAAGCTTPEEGAAPTTTADAAPQDAPDSDLSARWDEVRKTVTESAQSNAGTRPPPREGQHTIADLQAELESADQARVPAEIKARVAAAETVAAQLAERLGAGDLEGSLALTLDADAIAGFVSPGLLPILQGPVPARNREALTALVETFAGTEVRYEWVPGEVHVAARRGTFHSGTILLQSSRLRLEAGQTRQDVLVEQMVWHDDAWKIFLLGR